MIPSSRTLEAAPTADLGKTGRFDFDVEVWSLNGLLVGTLVGLIDASLVCAGCWMAVCLGMTVGLQPVVRWAEKVSQRRRNFWLDVAFGWALFPGPFVGSIFGALCPLLWEVPFTALQGALAGLVIGPLLAPFEGILIAALVVGSVWLISGKRMDQAKRAEPDGVMSSGLFPPP